MEKELFKIVGKEKDFYIMMSNEHGLYKALCHVYGDVITL
jgi:hypothetical protein